MSLAKFFGQPWMQEQWKQKLIWTEERLRQYAQRSGKRLEEVCSQGYSDEIDRLVDEPYRWANRPIGENYSGRVGKKIRYNTDADGSGHAGIVD